MDIEKNIGMNSSKEIFENGINNNGFSDFLNNFDKEDYNDVEKLNILESFIKYESNDDSTRNDIFEKTLELMKNKVLDENRLLQLFGELIADISGMDLNSLIIELESIDDIDLKEKIMIKLLLSKKTIFDSEDDFLEFIRELNIFTLDILQTIIYNPSNLNGISKFLVDKFDNDEFNDEEKEIVKNVIINNNSKFFDYISNRNLFDDQLISSDINMWIDNVIGNEDWIYLAKLYHQNSENDEIKEKIYSILEIEYDIKSMEYILSMINKNDPLYIEYKNKFVDKIVGDEKITFDEICLIIGNDNLDIHIRSAIVNSIIEDKYEQFTSYNIWELMKKVKKNDDMLKLLFDMIPEEDVFYSQIKSYYEGKISN